MNEKYLKFLEEAKKIKISKNFTLYEACYSDTALMHNISNIPNATQRSNIICTARKIAQPARDCLNRPILMSSWFRNLKLNRLVGGEPNSLHIKGQAADFGFNDKETILFIIKHFVKNNLEFDKLIFETNKDGVNWLHGQFVVGKNRYQALRGIYNQDLGKMVYTTLRV